METVKRRSILQFALLDIITLGIYGIVAGNGIGRDIDRLCEGDGEVEVSYIKAWLLGLVTGGIYLEYWWYKQANRLKLNAGRYHLTVREGGLSLIAFRTWSNLVGNLISLYFGFMMFGRLFSSFYTSLLGNIIGYGYGYGYGMAPSFGFGSGFFMLLLFISWLTPTWSIMGYVGLSFLIKNLNRYAEVSEAYEPLAFEPMGYAYYKADGNFPSGKQLTEDFTTSHNGNDSGVGIIWEPKKPGDDGATEMLLGRITGVSGSSRGYCIEMKDGEEIIIGKDPKVANIIIDSKYKEVSRKHCGITYIAMSNEYQVIDYSVNGTYVEGKRIPVRVKKKVSAGTEIVLGETENKFRLG